MKATLFEAAILICLGGTIATPALSQKEKSQKEKSQKERSKIARGQEKTADTQGAGKRSSSTVEVQATLKYECPMHPHIKKSKEGLCPSCGMDMVRVTSRPTGVQVPLIGLRDFCEDYLRKTLIEQPFNVPAFQVVAAHIALKGNDGRRELYTLLREGHQDWLNAAAFGLGELQDHQAIPILKRLLKVSAFAIDKDYYCTQHPHVTADELEACTQCGVELSSTAGLRINQLYFAGALHALGVDEGLDTLEAWTQKISPEYTLHFIARRDTPKARAILAEAQSSEIPRVKAAATLEQLGHGNEERFEAAVKLLKSDDSRIRLSAIQALGTSGMERAIKPLQKIVRDLDAELTDRVEAATALVQLGERSQQGFLMATFYQTKNRELRSQICYCLGEVGDKRALPVLQAAIAHADTYGIGITAAAKIIGRASRRETRKSR